MIPSTCFLRFLDRRLAHRFQRLHVRIVHFGIVLLILVASFFFLPAIVFTHIEPDWDYLDSLYYCFISLTTVGLGDYIPGDAQDQKYRALYKIFVTGKVHLRTKEKKPFIPTRRRIAASLGSP